MKINGNEIRPGNVIRVLVPPFITSGEKVIVDTNEISYVRRAD